MYNATQINRHPKRALFFFHCAPEPVPQQGQSEHVVIRHKLPCLFFGSVDLDTSHPTPTPMYLFLSIQGHVYVLIRPPPSIQWTETRVPLFFGSVVLHTSSSDHLLVSLFGSVALYTSCPTTSQSHLGSVGGTRVPFLQTSGPVHVLHHLPVPFDHVVDRDTSSSDHLLVPLLRFGGPVYVLHHLPVPLFGSSRPGSVCLISDQ